MFFCGIDIGSSYTKVAIIEKDNQDKNKSKVVATTIHKTGINFNQIAQDVFDEALKKANLQKDSIETIVSTGIGRNSCTISKFSKPEIGCFAKGAFFELGGPCVIVDIGGQDNKVIELEESGKQVSFKMNRKCAAGTGSFLEEIAMRLDMSPKKMNSLAMETKSAVPIGSYCTVFAGTEVIHHLRVEKDAASIMRGVYESVVKRIFEMAPLNIGKNIILTGGAIANNPVLIDLFNERLNEKVQIPKMPQYTGAIGAALYGLESY